MLLDTASPLSADTFNQVLGCRTSKIQSQNRPFMILRLVFHPSQVEQPHTPIPVSKGSKHLHTVGIIVNEGFLGPLRTDKLVSGRMEEEETNRQGTIPQMSSTFPFIAALIRQCWRASKLSTAPR